MATDPVSTHKLLNLLGKGLDFAALEQFLVDHRVHDRPKTVQQLKDEEVLDEDDEDIDVEYELEKMSQDSLDIFSERYSFSLLFKPKAEYELIYGERPEINADFVLSEIVFYAKNVRGNGYSGELPGQLKFGVRQSDAGYKLLGEPLASRKIYDAVADLYVIDDLIVNFGFSDVGEIAHVHARPMHAYDQVMLKPAIIPNERFDLAPIGADSIGLPVSSANVLGLLEALSINDELDQGVCPEEITAVTLSLGITLYFRDLPSGQHLSAITYKRRGDLMSKGFQGVLPFGFQFGDSPQSLIVKAGEPHIQHKSDQLMSYFWQAESGVIVQAMCSLIDWQLYRTTLHAGFLAAELGFTEF
jgi:hypothetical protein